jgi:L-alanine-DL-glutamate epimerase-like enolase superfamily enzyme
MSRRRVSLRRLDLSYADGMVLHTASSGAVPALDELRLVVEQDGGIAALGATRVNIAYLSGIDAEALVADCMRAVSSLAWERDWPDLLAQLDAEFPALAAPARMLVEMAVADGSARAAGQPLAVYLGGDAAAASPTNQTLFRADDAVLLARADAYVRRGFRDLKLRIAFGAFREDLRRLELLRAHFGDAIALSVDANGRWSMDEAAANLRALAPLGMSYIEQPVPAGDWTSIARLAADSPVPVMLDESLGSLAAVERLAATRAAPLAHLKLAKLGGLDRMMQAGRMLAGAGIGVMVGQMNEGAVSTLAVAHAAVALGAPYRELYGADGIADDPAGPLHYAGGALALPPGPGIGLDRHLPHGTLLWEHMA